MKWGAGLQQSSKGVFLALVHRSPTTHAAWFVALHTVVLHLPRQRDASARSQSQKVL